MSGKPVFLLVAAILSLGVSVPAPSMCSSCCPMPDELRSAGAGSQVERQGERRGRQWRVRKSRMGCRGGSRWDGLRRGLQRGHRRRPMAGQPAHRRREGQHGEWDERQADGALDRQSLRRQPAGGPLFGLEATQPVNPAVAFAGDAASFGTAADPMVGKPIGGLVVFGGGLALYDATGILGGLGISGDSSCADHNVAWRVRAAFGLDRVPAG